MAIDEAELGRQFDALSRQHHPDAGGDTDTFARLAEARSILTSTARRLRHLLELEAPGTTLDGPIPSGLITLFAGIGPVLQKANDLLSRKSAAASGLARALLASDEMLLREALEALASQLDHQLQAGAAAAASWNGQPATLASLAREAAFVEKWQSQVREMLLKLNL